MCLKKEVKLKTFRFGIMGVYSIQGKTLAFSRAVLNVFFSDAQWKPVIYIIQIDLANFFSTQIFFNSGRRVSFYFLAEWY